MALTEGIIQFIEKKSSELFEKVKAHREHLHQHPELSYKEFQTMKYVSEQLTELQIDHVKGVGETGVIAIIRSIDHNEGSPCIALRADLDALPIIEETNAPYTSLNHGVMHACGHDVHTAILLGVAEILNEIKDELPQPIKLIFQPGEEKNPGGASILIKEGVLTNPKVDAIYALHVFPDLETGYLGFKEGLYMASCDEIYITINGKGGHGATPHHCIDPIFIGAQVVTNLQSIVSRSCDPTVPCVLTIGHFEALGATNIIPSKAILKGTFRTMNEPWRKKALDQIVHEVKRIAEAHGASAEVEISKGYPFLNNDPELTKALKKGASSLFDTNKLVDLPIRMTSEDFSFYAQEVPACFFRLGVANTAIREQFGVHHPKFDIDPQALLHGMRAMAIAPFTKP